MKTKETLGGSRTSKRFEILDALRGILALTVVLGHLGMPPVFGSVDQNDLFLSGLARLWRTFAFGPPAVIAFFVISGFCIHIPYACTQEKLPVVRFYLRRYLRIGIPVLAAVAIILFTNPNAVLLGEGSILWRSTLWSLLCEEIYYAIYPILLFIIRRFGIWPVVLLSAILSIAIIIYTFPAVDWSDLGVIATSVVLLPVWLLGTALAEWVKSAEPLTSKGNRIRMVWWRVGIWFIMWLSLLLHFHGGLHQTATGILVGVIAFYWIRAEIVNSVIPSAYLLSFGAWSYSLYLIHPLVISHVDVIDYIPGGSLYGWALTMTLILGFSYLFFVFIEAPSHALAKRITLCTESAQLHGGKAIVDEWP